MNERELLSEWIQLLHRGEGVLAEIARLETQQLEREKLLNERFGSQEKAIKKAEDRLDSTLTGFPQEYARKTEMEQMRIDLAQTASTLAEKVTDSAKVLATAQNKVTERQDARLASLETNQLTRQTYETAHERLGERVTGLEKFQNKLLGLALTTPILTGIIFWLISH